MVKNMEKKKYDSIYIKSYYDEYGEGIGYDNKQLWMNNFNNIADSIIKIINPKTVLDIGCAYGYLVEALRKKGVEAYGIDVSEYAINQSEESIRPYLKCMSALDGLPENFPKQYDLLVSIEMIEHLYEEDGLKLIAKISEYSNQVLLSSTDSDFDDPTHFNVQPKEYWVEKFAHHSYLRNLQYDVTFISPNTYFFQKQNNLDIYKVINHYEKSIPIKKYNHTGIKSKVSKLLNTKLLFLKPVAKKMAKILNIK